MTFISMRFWWRVMGLCLTLGAMTPVLAETDEERDLAAIVELRKVLPNMVSVEVDFTNPVHEAGVYAMMRQNGETREKRPDLYAQIEQHKQIQRQRKVRGERLDGQPVGAPENFFSLLEYVDERVGNTTTENNTNMRVVISAYQASPDMPTTVSGYVSVFNEKQEKISGYIVDTSTPGSGIDTKWIDAMTSNVSPNVPNNPNLNPINGIGLMTFVDGQGQYLGARVAKLDTGAKPDNVYTTYSAPMPQHHGSSFVLLCINRENAAPQGDCDYKPTAQNKGASNENALLMVPFVGNIDSADDPFVYGNAGVVGRGGATFKDGAPGIIHVKLFPIATGGMLH